MASAGASILQQGIQDTKDLALNYFNYRANQWANAENFNNNVKLWKMNNDYNTPAMQMERLKEAGLNPNLVYGSGSVAGNTSSQPSAPAVHPSRFEMNLTNAFMGKNFRLMDEQLKGIREQNKLIKERYRALRYNNKFFEKSGLPTNAPWYAPQIYQYLNDPEKVNSLKGLGYKIGALYYDYSHENQPVFDPTPDGWTWNGKIDIQERR